jgi:DNA-directed RNA polymerase subunit L
MINPLSISSNVHDEVEIIDFLVDHNAMIKDFSRSQLTWFFLEENFHIVLFLAEGEKTRFERYTIERFSENMDDMVALWNTFDKRIQACQEVRVMKLAKNKVHDLIAMSETFEALFGRRDFEEE